VKARRIVETLKAKVLAVQGFVEISHTWSTCKTARAWADGGEQSRRGAAIKAPAAAYRTRVIPAALPTRKELGSRIQAPAEVWLRCWPKLELIQKEFNTGGREVSLAGLIRFFAGSAGGIEARETKKGGP